MGDPAVILASPIGQPVAQIFYNVTGKAGGIFFTLAAVLIISFSSIAGIQSTSRTVWAFSRDMMLPWSQVWYKLNATTGIPLFAVCLCAFTVIALDLIGLGSYVTISAIFNTCAICLDISYSIPIACKLLFGKFERGPWHLGAFSFWINLCAVLWTLFVSIIFCLPTFRPVTALNVNSTQTSMSFPLLLISEYRWIMPRLLLAPPWFSSWYTGMPQESSIIMVLGQILLSWMVREEICFE